MVYATFALRVLALVVAFFTLFNVFLCLKLFLSKKVLADIRWYNFPGPCPAKGGSREEMTTLLEKTFQTLQELDIPAVICYGTLWGVLRSNDFLEWDNNIDICVMDKFLINTSFTTLHQALWKRNVTIDTYDWWTGEYRIRLGSVQGIVGVFTDCTDHFYRTHWDWGHDVPPEIRLLGLEAPRDRWSCKRGLSSALFWDQPFMPQPVPGWLLEPPYTHMRLGHLQVPVPHDKLEMQKYIYPQDWWRELKPLNCV